MSDTNKFKSVEEYFNAQPENTRKALIKLKKCILEAAPDAQELLNYNIPAFALVRDGKRDQQIMIAGYKNHIGLYPHPTVMEKFDNELDGHKKGKGSVQFPLDKPLPTDLIKRMIKYRIELLKKIKIMDSQEMTITVETTIKAPIEQVWQFWTTPEHIINWNFATDQWCCPSAENDLRPGGEFNWRMEAKDGSMGFDFAGTYDEIEMYKRIKYTLDDGRKTEIIFSSIGDSTKIIETFEAENSISLEMQQTGWQSILNNFKKYTESI